MSTLKAYTVESCDSFVPTSVIEALGVRSHHRQARVLIFAPTKRRAAELAEASHLFGWHRNANGQRWLRLAMGNDLDALAPHFGAEEGILALPLTGSGSADGNVVRVQGETVTRVGHLEPHATPEYKHGRRFVGVAWGEVPIMACQIKGARCAGDGPLRSDPRGQLEMAYICDPCFADLRPQEAGQ
jgi:hypothetical protein